MSQNTDNIALTKQDANENFSRSILNANWDKVDAFAGECINKVQSGVSSISALSNLLDSLLSAMPSNGVKAFQFGFSAVESPFTQATYFGTLYKSGTGTTYSSAVFRRCDQPVTISGARNTNGWSFQQLALNSQLAQSYYDMKDSSTNAIGLIRFAGNKIAILSFTNQSGQISSSGLQLPYTFKDDISTLCQYYNGSANDYGQLIVSKTGLVQIRKSGQYVNATYVLGQITACLS